MSKAINFSVYDGIMVFYTVKAVLTMPLLLLLISALRIRSYRHVDVLSPRLEHLVTV